MVCRYMKSIRVIPINNKHSMNAPLKKVVQHSFLFGLKVVIDYQVSQKERIVDS